MPSQIKIEQPLEHQTVSENYNIKNTNTKATPRKDSDATIVEDISIQSKSATKKRLSVQTVVEETEISAKSPTLESDSLLTPSELEAKFENITLPNNNLNNVTNVPSGTPSNNYKDLSNASRSTISKIDPSKESLDTLLTIDMKKVPFNMLKQIYDRSQTRGLTGVDVAKAEQLRQKCLERQNVILRNETEKTKRSEMSFVDRIKQDIKEHTTKLPTFSFNNRSQRSNSNLGLTKNNTKGKDNTMS